MTERVHEGSRSIAVELVSDGTHELRAGCQRLFDDGVHVLDIEQDEDARPLECLGADRAQFWMFVGKHDDRVPEFHLRMGDLAPGC